MDKIIMLNEDSQRLLNYIECFDNILNNIDLELNNPQFATGGEVLHRGYYHPSPSFDIVVGNCNRGKLIKNISQSKKINYKYFFNDQNRLIYIEKYTNSILVEHEYLFYKGNKVIGFTYRRNNILSKVSECSYQNDLPISYIRILVLPYIKTVLTIIKEEYLYDTVNLITTSDFELCNTFDKEYKIIPEKQVLVANKYHFNSDDKGYLSTYTVSNYTGGIEFHNDKIIYSVRKKRRLTDFINNIYR